MVVRRDIKKVAREDGGDNGYSTKWCLNGVQGLGTGWVSTQRPALNLQSVVVHVLQAC
jgi:hypothetical protein